MSESTSTSTPETDTVRALYAALNRGDVAAFVRPFDANVERVELIGAGSSFSGLAAVAAHVAAGRGRWAEGGCEPRRLVVAGDRVIAFVDVRVRLRDETAWREGRVIDIYTFRDGRVIEFRTFVDEGEALRWAGVEAADAGDEAAKQAGAA